MAKEKEVSEVEVPVSDRKERWDALLAALEKQNPLAFAARKASGEFDKPIPDYFV